VTSYAVAGFNTRVTPCVPPWDRCPSRGHGVPLRPTAPPYVLWRMSSFEWNLVSSVSAISQEKYVTLRNAP